MQGLSRHPDTLSDRVQPAGKVSPQLTLRRVVALNTDIRARISAWLRYGVSIISWVWLQRRDSVSSSRMRVPRAAASTGR